MQRISRPRVSKPFTDPRLRISAYRLVACSSVVYCMLSMLSVCITLPMLTRVVHQLKRTMHNEIAFCKVSAADIRSEVHRLKATFDPALNRTARHARRPQRAGRVSGWMEGSADNEPEEMSQDVFETDEGSRSRTHWKSSTTRQYEAWKQRRPKYKNISEESDEDLLDKTPGVKISLENPNGRKEKKKDHRKGKAVAPYESENRCNACCLPGKSGPKGQHGRPGKTGKQGAPGLPGNPGRALQQPCMPMTPPPCKPCPRGPPGARGPPGEPGDAGAPGMPVRRGRFGEQGSPGPNGPRGPPGKDGKPGPPGAPGTPARSEELIRGDPGPVGPPGHRGPPGSRGEPGVNGQHGVPGQKGPPGPDGAPGTNGKPGSIGSHGRPGDRGERGICPRYCALDGGVFFEDATKRA